MFIINMFASEFNHWVEYLPCGLLLRNDYIYRKSSILNEKDSLKKKRDPNSGGTVSKRYDHISTVIFGGTTARDHSGFIFAEMCR